jgi:hypothetical protein
MLMMRALLLTLALLTASQAFADAQYEGTGRAPISGGDRVRARDRALDDAFQHVVEAAVTQLLGADTLTRRASDMRLKVLPRARSYITSYRILSENSDEPGFLTVQVGADVQSDRLVHELAAPIATQKAVPASATKIGVCVHSQAPVPRFEEALRARLEAQGLLLVACEDNARVLVTADVAPAEESPIRGTSLLGREVQVQLALTDGGARRADGKGQGAGFGASPAAALDDAALAALTATAPALDDALGTLGPHAVSNAILVVHAAGVRKLAQLTIVRTALERISGVESVELRRVNAQGPVDLGVHTSLSERALFDALTRSAPTYRIRPREENGAITVDVPDASDPYAPAGTP